MKAPAWLGVAASLLAAVCGRQPVEGVELEGFRYSRMLVIESAGWVEVPLDLDVLLHMAPDGEDLHLFAPSGKETPYRLALARSPAAERQAQVLEVTRLPNGWLVRIDTGARPLRHDRLLFEFSELTTVPDLRLEASGDGSTWHLLAVTDLFRLGEGGGLQRTAVDYPVTGERYLRLWWPRQAGYPQVRRIAVAALPTLATRQVTQAPQCRAPEAGRTVCSLEVTAPGAVRLTLEVAATGLTGYRLYLPAAGSWSLLREGTWAWPQQQSPPPAVLSFEGLGRQSLRLELSGSPEEPPALQRYRLDYPPRVLQFRASEVGQYVLAYGTERRTGARALPAPTMVAARWVEPGPEIELQPPALPSAAGSPGSLMPERRFAARWRVEAPAAEAGDLVRLELPEAVYSSARWDLADLRLATEGRQIPYVRWTPAEPAVVLQKRGVAPVSGSRPGISRIELELGATSLPITQLQLTGGSGPFERRIRARLARDARPGTEPVQWTLGWTAWRCADVPALPCRLTLPLPGGSDSRRLILELEDGDNPALPALDIDLWRRRDVLLFVWPGEGSVELAAGAPKLRSPTYDLSLLEDRLLKEPWHEAILDLAFAAEQAERSEARNRVLLLTTLALAALALLWLLARVLRQPSG